VFKHMSVKLWELPMEKKIEGLHHITALASDPQRNYDFYTKTMGLRFVKKTVNFDAPDVYHFYFGDETGTPGTILTFFPFPHAREGKRGTGEADLVSFAVPKGSLEFWAGHLSRYGVDFTGPDKKFGSDCISFSDPDGMRLELVEDDVDRLQGWETEDLPRAHSIRKFFGVSLSLRRSEKTESLIRDVLGFRFFGEDANLRRCISGTRDLEAKLDIRIDAEGPYAIQSAGSVHHIAWRTESENSQLMWMERLRTSGHNTTEVIDRNYFHSIYFREPGGVLFEIATDQPGFMIDEDRDSLGETLKLPGRYESSRAVIESRLIPISHRNKQTVTA